MVMNRGHVACVVAAVALATSVLVSANTEPYQFSWWASAKDPGVRQGSTDAGGAIAGLTGTESAFFTASADVFSENEAIEEGLGPRMNLDSCAGCHAHPAVGGTSPAANPQLSFAQSDGTDSIPSFITANGPVREARFVRNRDGSPDGGVHDLFTITGRAGTGGCSLAQPNFDAQLANHNVIFRIPTPVFGAGLIEQIPDQAILANQALNAPQKSAYGIAGRPNYQFFGRTITGQTNNNGNDGTIARFGWKAQNKSLLLFAGEAYNVEQGVTNELFPTERDETPSCQFAGTPNDFIHTDATDPIGTLSNLEEFAIFMRFLAPPTPSADMPGGSMSIANGSNLFSAVGCAFCHTRSFTTGDSSVAALRQQPVNLFSDLLVHDIGIGLADGVSQGQAGPREFRTAPLWGLGQRIFFLHDGRTTDLLAAIRAHRSPGSEANVVIAGFNALGEWQKQDLLNFLRSR
jgi:CxxC motif-containing protein (DUF1111 family)